MYILAFFGNEVKNALSEPIEMLRHWDLHFSLTSVPTSVAYESRTYPGTKKMYVTGGNSFVAAVEFGEKID